MSKKKLEIDEFNRHVDEIRRLNQKANAERLRLAPKPKAIVKVRVTSDNVHLLSYDNTSSPEEVKAADQAARDFKEKWSC